MANALRLKGSRKYPNVPVINDDPAVHTAALIALKESMEIGQRRTPDIFNSFIRVQDLLDLGLIDLKGNTQSVVGADLSQIANIGDLTGAAAGDFLRYDGTEWVNQDLNTSDITQVMVTQHEAALSIDWSQLTSIPALVLETRTLTAGAGLTGGGDLSANRTFDVGAGTGISVNANDVAVDQTFAPTWTATHTYSLNATIAAPNILLSNNNPLIRLSETDQGLDGKHWSLEAVGGVLALRARNDAFSISRNAFTMFRSGVALTDLEFGNFTDLPNIAFYGHMRLMSDARELQLGVGQDLRLYHDGTNSIIQNDTGQLRFEGTSGDFYRNGAAGTVREFGFQTSGAYRWLFRCTGGAEGGANSGSDFQWLSRTDAGSALMTVLSILRSNGHLLMENDNQELRIGAGQDLRFYHDGTDSWIKNDTGILNFRVPASQHFHFEAPQGQIRLNSSTNTNAASLLFYLGGVNKARWGVEGTANATVTGSAVGDGFLVVLDSKRILFGDVTTDKFYGAFANSAVAGETRLMVFDVDNNTLERVTVGAADSGGTGFKVLRIPN